MSQLVNAKKLLEILFDDKSRPSINWVRDQTQARAIPCIRIGHLVFYDVDQVRQHLEKHNTVKAR